MQFETQLRRARITYAVLMATFMCIVMSIVSTTVLRPSADFWASWPKLLLIDLCVAIPVAILLGPLVRRICTFFFNDLPH